MKSGRKSAYELHLLIGFSITAFMLGGCNKQPGTTLGAAMVAPPEAALPLAQGNVNAAPAPMGPALAPAAASLRYAPQSGANGYGYIDRANSMGGAFADTPPDYTVDYQGTRPWVWRADDGAYRIVERLPQGDRYFYYDAGEDYPFLVRDPDYSYAYDHGDLVAVYGSDGRELDRALASRRADAASRYFSRAHELYRAANYEQRQSAYAGAWADRQSQFHSDSAAWRQQQAQNPQWRAWHDSHQAEEQNQWGQERQHRIAYAEAIGIAAAAAIKPTEVAQRQAEYISNWSRTHTSAPAAEHRAVAATNSSAPLNVAPPAATIKPKFASAMPSPAASSPAPPNKVAPKAQVAQAERVQKHAIQAEHRNASEAKVSSAQAVHEQQLANEAQRRETAAAQTRSAQTAQAQKLASQARQHEAAAAQAPATNKAQSEKAAAGTNGRESVAAERKAAEAAQAEKSAAQAKQNDAAAAQAKAAQAAQEQKAAAAKQQEAAAAQSKAAHAKAVEKPPARDKQNGSKTTEQSAKKPDAGEEKRKGKDRKTDQPQ